MSLNSEQLAAIEAAYVAAKGQWRGCDWQTEHGAYKLDLQGQSAYVARFIADELTKAAKAETERHACEMLGRMYFLPERLSEPQEDWPQLVCGNRLSIEHSSKAYSVEADWTDEKCVIQGFPVVRHVGDFGHNPWLALRALLYDSGVSVNGLLDESSGFEPEWSFVEPPESDWRIFAGPDGLLAPRQHAWLLSKDYASAADFLLEIEEGAEHVESIALGILEDCKTNGDLRAIEFALGNIVSTCQQHGPEGFAWDGPWGEFNKAVLDAINTQRFGNQITTP